MICPKCANPTTGVKKTQANGSEIRRRRRCRTCRHLFWTAERPIDGDRRSDSDRREEINRLLERLKELMG